MGRLKHYQHCEVIIAPEGNVQLVAVRMKWYTRN